MTNLLRCKAFVTIIEGSPQRVGLPTLLCE